MAGRHFNGTDTRKPVGFGEVSLTFTNCDEELGIEWHDVRVTRRVSRRKFRIPAKQNAVPAARQLKSLRRHGVARSAYSIMEQGKIDMILSSRPEDRRTVFEEAAGITKYKTQKREALRKLKRSLRIGDVIKEVKRQIGSLQRQAGKARRYQALHTDLRVSIVAGEIHKKRSDRMARLQELQLALSKSETRISALKRSSPEPKPAVN